jgi:hypothetical protein
MLPHGVGNRLPSAAVWSGNDQDKSVRRRNRARWPRDLEDRTVRAPGAGNVEGARAPTMPRASSRSASCRILASSEVGMMLAEKLWASIAWATVAILVLAQAMSLIPVMLSPPLAVMPASVAVSSFLPPRNRATARLPTALQDLLLLAYEASARFAKHVAGALDRGGHHLRAPARRATMKRQVIASVQKRVIIMYPFER